MLPFKKILFPVDYSEPCELAVPFVKEMLRHFSGELTLVHAYGAEALAYSQLGLDDPALPGEAKAHEEERLHEFAAETFPGQHVETFAELCEAGTAIHNVIERQGTDLVMLPTHGRGPVRRFLLGSVAAKALHDTSAAVWTSTVAALKEHASKEGYRSILCAIDDSEEAAAVLTASSSLAKSHHAHLYLVSVVETPSTSFDIDFTPYKKDLMDAADFKMRELKGQLGIDAHHSVIDGSVAGAVHNEAILRKADLIVIGRGRAQTTFERIWSHVYPIVREAPCPVLSI